MFLVRELLQFAQVRLHEIVVDDLCALEARVEHPREEDDLQQLVARDEEEQHSDHSIEGSQQAEHDPVRQPHRRN